MNCSDAIKIINDYFDGALSNEQVKDMELHISKCPQCKHEHAIFLNLFESIKLLPMNIPLPKKMASQVFDEITAEEESERTKSGGVFKKIKSKIRKK
jgi:anti-sigma factor RsiW